MRPHGTQRRYEGGCRCDGCREANRLSKQQHREQARQRGFTGYTHGTESTYRVGCRCDLCHAAHTGQAAVRSSTPLMISHYASDPRVRGDALQVATLVREYGPELLGRMFDTWEPDHLRAVCAALAAAVDIDRTPQELWGWLGPVRKQMSNTVTAQRLLAQGDPHALTPEEIQNIRPADPGTRAKRAERRQPKGGSRNPLPASSVKVRREQIRRERKRRAA